MNLSHLRDKFHFNHTPHHISYFNIKKQVTLQQRHLFNKRVKKNKYKKRLYSQITSNGITLRNNSHNIVLLSKNANKNV